VTAVTVPWDATKQPDGTVVDTATGQPVPDDATVTCIPGTPGEWMSAFFDGCTPQQEPPHPRPAGDDGTPPPAP
ncbi:hypothetical protein, partial [Streptomyces fuscigenes]|uniref:hypothetical protein n=1 Tax=Streptomyces fuscigenes TaxID=1528880 RepID=UPI001F3000A9